MLSGRNRDLRLLTRTTNPTIAAAVSCKGTLIWHVGQQLREITKKLAHETTTHTLSLGKVSPAVFAVFLPRDFQRSALDKKTQTEAVAVIPLSLSPSSVLQTLEFNDFCILLISYQLS